MKEFPQFLRHPSGGIMSLERDRVLVGIRPSAPIATSRTPTSVLDELGLVMETANQLRGAGPVANARSITPSAKINHLPNRVWARTVRGNAFTTSQLDVGSPLANSLPNELNWIAPVYRLEDKGRVEFLAPLPHVLLIQPNPVADPSVVEETLRQYGLQKDEIKSRYLGKMDYYVLENPLETNSLEILEDLIEQNQSLVQEARFETMPMSIPLAYIPNDSIYPSQWNMDRIRASGNGQSGWNLQRGTSNVVIAVLDTGCDLTHPDLAANYVDNGINLGSMTPSGLPRGIPEVIGHGTACAGIAAAIHNMEGVAGVAGNCGILPLAFNAWTDVEVASGIRYASMNGARVISMSFGDNGWDPAIIDPAIQEAFNNDVVMCVATHNYDGPITYPATNPLVIACGASDQNDNRKSPSSPDGESWGSNYGSEISVVAPGVLIPTTDIQGNTGYSSSDYELRFNGTSSATPHVAGLAALLISHNPMLTNIEVRNLIERSAEKVGVVPYDNTIGKPNGRWNREMGYGRINVLGALESADQSLMFTLQSLNQPSLESPLIGVVRTLDTGFQTPLVQSLDSTLLEDVYLRLEKIEQQLSNITAYQKNNLIPTGKDGRE